MSPELLFEDYKLKLDYSSDTEFERTSHDAIDVRPHACAISKRTIV